MENNIKKDCGRGRELYERFTPFFHIGGLLLVVGLTVGVYHARFDDMSAHASTIDTQIATTDMRVSAVENQLAHISQRLDDLCEFWHVPRHH